MNHWIPFNYSKIDKNDKHWRSPNKNDFTFIFYSLVFVKIKNKIWHTQTLLLLEFWTFTTLSYFSSNSNSATGKNPIFILPRDHAMKKFQKI